MALGSMNEKHWKRAEGMGISPEPKEACGKQRWQRDARWMAAVVVALERGVAVACLGEKPSDK